MSDIQSFASRDDAESSAVEKKVKSMQDTQVESHKQRQARLEQFGKVFEQ